MEPFIRRERKNTRVSFSHCVKTKEKGAISNLQSGKRAFTKNWIYWCLEVELPRLWKCEKTLYIV